MAKLTDTDVTRFRGLNNRTDPMRLGLSWLTVARNVNITDEGGIERRDGYSQHLTGAIHGAYSTIDFERLYYLDAGALKTGSGTTLATGLSTTRRMQWTEVNDHVYYCNGLSDGIILPDESVRRWSWDIPVSPMLAAVTGSLPAGLYRVVCTTVLADGRETGPSDEVFLELTADQALQISGVQVPTGCKTRVYIAPANGQVFQLARTFTAAGAFVWNNAPDQLGVECATLGTDPLPLDVVAIAVWGGRAYAAVYDRTAGITFIYPSKPLAFHLFDLEDYLPIAGQVHMLAPTDSALVVGSDSALGAVMPDGTLQALADYGVVPGWPWATDQDDKSILIWSTRGLCRAMPFKNLTQGHLSVAPGVQAGAAVIEADGQKRLVVSLHAGGAAFNSRS